MRGEVVAVVGGQYGSEGKGVITAHLARTGRFTACARVGGPNSGHSVFEGGRLWKLRCVPAGFVDPDCNLVIGRCAVIDPGVLFNEVDALEQAGYKVKDRLYVDRRALVITPAHATDSRKWLRFVGSPATGVGQARMECMKRSGGSPTAGDYSLEFEAAGVKLSAFTGASLRGYVECGGSILLEGTQGFGLSLHYGTWPYVTSADCTAAQLLNDVGIPPAWLTDVVLVVRRFPIRVAGDSGPLPGEGRISWGWLSKKLGREVIEHTTVTGNVRRIGWFDPLMVEHAVGVNGATAIALTFVDYDRAENQGVDRSCDLSLYSRNMIDRLEQEMHIPVRYVGTGRRSDDEQFTIIER